MNLLTNAVKHGAPQPVTVRGHIDKGAGVCRIEIEDMGPGISDEIKQRVFERRFAEGSKKAPKGSGLGLTIVKTLADRYHGRVWAEDRIKGDHTKGAKFIVELPLAETQSARA
jgi:signal transduction histidine kinase